MKSAQQLVEGIQIVRLLVQFAEYHLEAGMNLFQVSYTDQIVITMAQTNNEPSHAQVQCLST